MADYATSEKVEHKMDPRSVNDTAASSSVDTKEKVPVPSTVHDTEVEGAITKNGLKVHPQPTTDPLDPLNWSRGRKAIILSVVMIKYFMFTYITTTTVASLFDLQDLYSVSYAQILWTVALPALGLAAGPVFWSSFADIYGRRVIFIIGSLISIGATIGAALATDYAGYMASRFFQGFGVSPAAVVGLAVINDMYFDHERGQKVGFWVLALDMGLLVGPLTGGFLNLVSPQWIQWFSAIVFAVLLALEVAFMPETLYPRNRMLTHLPATHQIGQKTTADIEDVSRRRSDASEVTLPRTKKLPFINVKPVPGMRHPKPWDSLVRVFQTFPFAVVTIAVFMYCFIWYWWMLSVITMLPVAYENYSPQIQGLLFIGLILGTLLSELFFSGRLSDVISQRLAKKRGHQVRLPEDRLWLAYPAIVLTAVGLILWGISIDQAYHWMVGQVALFLFAAGIQIGNTCIAAYVVDSYPLQSMSVIVFYSVWLNLSAFINPFFIEPFQVATGFTWCFAAQGIIVFFGATPILFVLQKFGPSLRAKNGQPSWVNAEYDSR